MKKLITSVLFLSISSLCLAQTGEPQTQNKTQNGAEIKKDTISAVAAFDDDDEITVIRTTKPISNVDEDDDNVVPRIKPRFPRQNFVFKNGKTLLQHSFRGGVFFGEDKVMSDDNMGGGEDFSDDVDEKTEQGTTLGINLSYRLTFFPGRLENRNFIVNPLGFGYSFGVDISGDLQKSYGFRCDVFAAAGIEFGGAKFGFGFNALVGTGNLTGFEIQVHADPELCGIFKESHMSFKYGAEIWLKVPSLFGGLVGTQVAGVDSGRDMRIFARYIKNSVPKDEIAEDFMVFSMFPSQYFQVGISFSF